MLVERIILIAMWLSGFVGWILLIPRNNRRKAILALLMFQAIIWLCDIPSFQLGLLSAPGESTGGSSYLSGLYQRVFYSSYPNIKFD
ncbi:hypothetical protein ACT8ZR_03110 [Neobacillus sp. M.A.Huq-85]|nr:hypothetical protein QNK12_13855 [Neobacillus cucumis]